MKLALIIDKSEAFISFHKSQLFEEWRLEAKDFKHGSRIGDIGGTNLFGENAANLIRLDTKEDVQSFTKDLEKKTSIDDLIGLGLIITTTVPRQSTKKIEKLVKDFGGQVLISKGEKNETPVEAIVSQINLNKSAKNFLLSYAGDDYELVIPIVRTLSKLSSKQQGMVSEQDIFTRLPQPPGSLPPWEVDKALSRGNLSKTIENFRRVSEHSSFLVVLAVLNNKFRLMYKISALLASDPRMSAEKLSQILGVPNNYPLKLAIQGAKKYKMRKLQSVVEILTETEKNCKGGLNADHMVMVETSLVKIDAILKT